jgi:4-aminobutyrate aminotransferase-like enzyme
VLDEIEERGLIARVAEVGAHLKQALSRRAGAWSAIGDVRGEGLFVGVEMIREADGDPKAPHSALAVAVCNRLKDQGFLTSNAGAFGNVVKIRPPLVFSMDDAEAFLVAWDETVAELHG